MDRYLTQSSPLMDDADLDLFESGLVPTTSSTMPTSQDTSVDLTKSNPMTDPMQVLTALETAPMTEECRAKAKGIINELMKGHMPTATDAVWTQAVVAAAMGNGNYPPECVSSGFPWWAWLLIGGGACVVVLIILSMNSKKK